MIEEGRLFLDDRRRNLENRRQPLFEAFHEPIG